VSRLGIPRDMPHAIFILPYLIHAVLERNFFVAFCRDKGDEVFKFYNADRWRHGQMSSYPRHRVSWLTRSCDGSFEVFGGARCTAGPSGAIRSVLSRFSILCSAWCTVERIGSFAPACRSSPHNSLSLARERPAIALTP
jgi:hypothetical protein